MAGIYIHIPFCKSRCSYCDFYSGIRHHLKDQYIQALTKELALRSSYLDKERIETIYFGGGTPSQLTPADFRKIFDTVFSHYRVEVCEEVTLEANPDDLSPDYIRSLLELPFNRISLGVQSFNPRHLKLLNRRHTGKQAMDAVKACRKAGFDNISIDLMYGLPGQTVAEWQDDLDRALELSPEHVSAYHLIYEEGTPLTEMLKERKIREVEEEHSLELLDRLISSLKGAGYLHYEISNFAKPGKFSLHNSGYWRAEHYLGCGPSAHSFNGKSRHWNVSSLEKYIKDIDNPEKITEQEVLDLYTRYNEFVITSLRTMWGLDLEKLERLFGTELLGYCVRNAAPYLDNARLKQENGKIILTEKGLFLSDRIMSDLLWVS